MSGRRSSAPNCANRQEFASFKLSRALYRIANRLPPTPKKPPKPEDKRHQNVRVSDEVVLKIQTHYLRGGCVAELTRELGVDYKQAMGWCDGRLRGHLLVQAEKIVRAERGSA